MESPSEITPHTAGSAACRLIRVGVIIGDCSSLYLPAYSSFCIPIFAAVLKKRTKRRKIRIMVHRLYIYNPSSLYMYIHIHTYIINVKRYLIIFSYIKEIKFHK